MTSIDDLYAAMKAASIIKNKREFSVYADCASNYYADSPKRKKFAGDALVRIANKLAKEGHTELAAIATAALFDDMRSRRVDGDGSGSDGYASPGNAGSYNDGGRAAAGEKGEESRRRRRG